MDEAPNKSVSSSSGGQWHVGTAVGADGNPRPGVPAKRRGERERGKNEMLQIQHVTILAALGSDNDNDNDNDTLKEVPHPSNEGLALQARVSGPWHHKKESVLLVELARWQGVQTQTVNGQSAMQQVLR